jgi:2-C-methyl-D-erythritol 4-phosphate cytidylyltransferase/2-C-methyl-D-erythritol 2,4-cyclodiphosphate synthase
MRTTAIIAAGGRGRRLGASVPKQLLAIGGRPMLQLSVEAFANHARVDALVVVLPAEVVETPPDYLRHGPKPIRLVVGGERRQDSVANGLAAIDERTDVVVVHDAARPFVDADLIDRAIDGAVQSGAAICAIQARDTVKVAERDAADAENRAWIGHTLPRDVVFLAQTPQAFRRDVLADAVRLGQAGVEATDEAFLAEQSGHRVRLVEGSARNIKITSADDLALAQSLGDDRRLDSGHRTPDSGLSVGLGYDIHRLVEGRRLILGGVEMPFERGLAGHSDADVLCHAITDAILGAAGAGDIGRHFPDTDERWRDVSSIDLLRRAACLIADQGFAVVNVDAVVIAERPKILAHVPAIVEHLAGALHLSPQAISVKGKTNEGLGAIGRGEAIACQVVALLRRVDHRLTTPTSD